MRVEETMTAVAIAAAAAAAAIDPMRARRSARWSTLAAGNGTRLLHHHFLLSIIVSLAAPSFSLSVCKDCLTHGLCYFACSAYADSIQSGIQSRLGVLFDVCFIENNSISQTLDKALRHGYRYSIIAGGQNERKNTLNLNVLRTVGEERMSDSCAFVCPFFY